LINVAAEARAFMFECSSPGASMMRTNYAQLRTAMIDSHYITQRQFDEDLAQLDNPAFIMPSGILWSAWGRRP
jgi:hypothetical protein